MKNLVLIFILIKLSSLFLVSQSIAQECHGIFSNISILNSEATEIKRVNLVSISKKLKNYFNSRATSENKKFDQSSAANIFKYLKKFGTQVDLEIFDTYLYIHQNTRGDFNIRETGLFYIDTHLSERPKSTHFRNIHWDWSIFEGYFRTTPSVLSFTKEQDLAYLKEIKKVVVEKRGEVSLVEALEEANNNWTLSYLNLNSPKIATEFQKFLNLSYKNDITYSNSSSRYSILYKDFIEKVEVTLRSFPKGEMDFLFIKSLYESIEYFKSSYSSFDLFLFSKYFELVTRLPINENLAQSLSNYKMQLTHWSVFNEGLPFGSVGYTTDFIFQNSHDTSVKAHLLKIYNKMHNLILKNELEKTSESSFFSKFVLARTYVENESRLVEAPVSYQTDLRIFSLVSDTAVQKDSKSHLPELAWPRYDEVLVTWNPFLGKLQSYVVSSYNLKSEVLPITRENSRLKSYFKVYFDTLRKNKTISDDLINKFEKEELDSILARSTVFAFTDPKNNELLALMRVFDGSHLNFHSKVEQERYEKIDYRLPVVQTFPKVEILELTSQQYVLEIGRVLATKEIEANSYDIMMGRIAEFFSLRGMKGIIYLSSPPAMARYNKKKGASVVYTPEQLLERNSNANGDSVYILKISISDFINRFYNSNYESVRYRETLHR